MVLAIHPKEFSFVCKKRLSILTIVNAVSTLDAQLSEQRQFGQMNKLNTCNLLQTL